MIILNAKLDALKFLFRLSVLCLKALLMATKYTDTNQSGEGIAWIIPSLHPAKPSSPLPASVSAPYSPSSISHSAFSEAHSHLSTP